MDEAVRWINSMFQLIDFLGKFICRIFDLDVMPVIIFTVSLQVVQL